MPTYSDNCGNSYELPEHVRNYKVEVDPKKGISLAPTMDYLINPEEEEFFDNLYRFSFGAYGSMYCLVYGRDCESALETAADWLSEHCPGVFTDPSTEEVARKELAEDLQVDPSTLTEDEVFEYATMDLTYTESGYLASWEWFVRNASEDEVGACKTLCDIINDL